METRDFTAKSVKDAIDQATLFFGISKDDLEFEVVAEGKSGLLGFGAEDATIRAVVPNDEEFEDIPDEEVIETSRALLETTLQLMGFEAYVDLKAADGSALHGTSEFLANITGEDLALLIGRRGETLDSLQFLMNVMIAKRLGAPVRVSVDIEHYKARRTNSLMDLAKRIADRVNTSRQPMALEPMKPNERRIIHLTLKDHPTVKTDSVGEGEGRQVVISPREGARGPVRQVAPPRREGDRQPRFEQRPPG